MSRDKYYKPDAFSLKAKKEGYLARSVYKLEEINLKYQILKPKQKVLDLGAFPGSWSQYSLKKVGEKGKVVGVDIQNIEHHLGKNYFFYHQSILDENLDLSPFTPFDVIISDMAPQTSGIKDKDVYESVQLSLMAIQMAQKHLKKEGVFIGKVFQGEDFDDFYKDFKKVFVKVKSFKPKAVRSNSKEIYAIGWGLKPYLF